jgi:hypothetical protein
MNVFVFLLLLRSCKTFVEMTTPNKPQNLISNGLSPANQKSQARACRNRCSSDGSGQLSYGANKTAQKKQHVIATCCLLSDSEGTRTPNLLIRSHPDGSGQLSYGANKTGQKKAACFCNMLPVK